MKLSRGPLGPKKMGSPPKYYDQHSIGYFDHSIKVNNTKGRQLRGSYNNSELSKREPDLVNIQNSN